MKKKLIIGTLVLIILIIVFHDNKSKVLHGKWKGKLLNQEVTYIINMNKKAMQLTVGSDDFKIPMEIEEILKVKSDGGNRILITTQEKIKVARVIDNNHIVLDDISLERIPAK